MPNGDSSTATPDIQTILSDDNFKSLPIGEKHKVMLKADPDYAGLPPREQAHALTRIHYGPEQKQDDLGGGSPWVRGIYGIGRGLNDAVEATYQTIIHPIDTASAIATQIEEAPGKMRAASQEPGTVNKLADIGAAVPVLGPFGKALGERAGKGDVAGAITEGVSSIAAPFAAKEAAGKVPVEDVRSTGRAVARDVAKKYVGKTIADKILPPPPEPAPSPQEVEYQRTKTITEAQEAAQTENEKRAAVTQRKTQQAAKQREAAFNKEGQEKMAIQQRYDDAQEARAKAEKEAKNARFKADQEHEKELAAAEKARQDEITVQAKLKQVQDQMEEADRAKEAGRLKLLQQQEKQAIRDANEAAAQKERLKNQHAQALMRRGREQAALDRAAEAANKEEDSAKAAVQKSSKGGGTSNNRPTASERFLTGLLKRNVLTPEEDAQGLRLFGDKWKLRAGEGPAGRTNRLMGDIHAMRPSRGMGDVSTGPIPPPPEPSMPTKDAVEKAGGVYGKRGGSGHEMKLPLSMTKDLPIPDWQKPHVSITIPEDSITPEQVRTRMANKLADFNK